MSDPARPGADAGRDLGEPAAVAARYARRSDPGRYSLLRPEVMHAVHERQRALRAMLVRHGWDGLAGRSLLEVGCGAGGNLLELLRLGLDPARAVGVELLPERAAEARRVLPAALEVIEGDALQAGLPAAHFDLVLVSTVFSSLLDDAFQERLAQAMWSWTRPGGAVLWYDFTVDNPRNADVRGVPLARVRALFPQAAALDARRVTLAPPLARAAARLHPALCGLLGALPPLRTHLLAWIDKPR